MRGGTASLPSSIALVAQAKIPRPLKVWTRLDHEAALMESFIRPLSFHKCVTTLDGLGRHSVKHSLLPITRPSPQSPPPFPYHKQVINCCDESKWRPHTSDWLITYCRDTALCLLTDYSSDTPRVSTRAQPYSPSL